MPTRDVNLTDHFDSFIESGIRSGRFSSASEMVREGLELLEQRDRENEAKLTWLRAATQEALDAFDRGEGIPLDSVEDIDDFVSQAMDEMRATRELTHG